MTSHSYIVYRVGSKTSNQPMSNRFPVMPVGVYRAPGREAACQLADGEWGCHPNQHFEAVPASRSRVADVREAEDRQTRGGRVDRP